MSFLQNKFWRHYVDAATTYNHVFSYLFKDDCFTLSKTITIVFYITIIVKILKPMFNQSLNQSVIIRFIVFPVATGNCC